MPLLLRSGDAALYAILATVRLRIAAWNVHQRRQAWQVIDAKLDSAVILA